MKMFWQLLFSVRSGSRETALEFPQRLVSATQRYTQVFPIIFLTIYLRNFHVILKKYCIHRNFSDLTIIAIIATQIKTLLKLSLYFL